MDCFIIKFNIYHTCVKERYYMRDYDFVLFDLDGTLTDPGTGITNSVAYALAKYGIHIDDKTSLYKFIGPPLIDSFMKYYGFSHAQAVEAVEFYREYYTATGMFENSVYQGIPELLASLKNAGKNIMVATSKPEIFAEKIMKYFGLDVYFTYIAGANMDETRTYKDEIIDYALKKVGADDCSKIIMIGDREYDVIGAKKFGIDSIGVLFGYGSREELEKAGATYIAETVDDIRKFVLKN